MKPLGPHDPHWAGRHRLIAVIGQGAMGRVLLGRAPDGRLVAVKMIHRHLAQNPEFRARFRLEVQASQRVTGAYTAAVMDADPDATDPWLASIYVPGPSLREAVDGFGPIPLGGLRLLTAGLASALLEIHRAGMIHRDLKPSNVLLSAGGPRVIDFGIARALAAETQLTSAGSLIGSPAFMSPEQAEGRELTTASDVFAVGAMLVLAATGQSPFLGASTPQTLYNIVHSRPDTSGVPAVLRPVVDACLSKHPAYRPTPVQVLESVGSISARAGWPAGIQWRIEDGRAEAERCVRTDGRPPELRARRPIRWIAAGAAAVAAAGGAAAVVLTNGGSATPPDPLANRTLSMSDDQLRRVDTCKLLGTDVVGSLGQPVRPDFTNSSVCTTKFVTPDGKQPTMTVGVGTSVASAKPTSDTLVGSPVLDTTTDPRSCGRAILAREHPRLGIDLKITDADGDSCELAMAGLKSVVTRLVTDPPAAALPGRSVVAADPCASADPAAVAQAVGPGIQPTQTDIHTCRWQGPALSMQIRMIEAKRVDTDPEYELFSLGDELQLLPHDGARRVESDGTCASYLTVQPTVADRAEMAVVTAHPTGPAVGNACDINNAVLTTVVKRLVL
ncbi:serine/threonine-protein kinase [Nocardia transvalensis]|uniref:serine/threonine-protein kinase n=1 Tax=Nocardia transvalensis TaxID=37333 RepID=UPI001895CA05|nr:serine/threonine-protein kinase [Nocardia transvalensis]MBF6330439.1 serine/threonine protein kinase [Nocardia transvalensis]